MPGDSANFSRGLNVLERAGIIRLDSIIDKTKATKDDIVSNPKNIVLVPPMEEDLAASLSIYDLSVMDGHYAISGGLSLNEALYSETMNDDYMTIIAVRTIDMAEQFVFDIIKVLHSEEYRIIILDTNGKFANFRRRS